MASIRQTSSGGYFARVRYRINKIRKEVYIGLNTQNLKLALKYLDEVQLNEAKIKEGYDIAWSWKTGKKTQIKVYKLGEVSDLWLESRKNSIHITESHYKRNVISMNRLIDVLKKDFSIQDTTEKDIEAFETYYSDRHTKAGININLRAIKTFLKWCFDNRYIDRVPKIIIKVPKQEPKYIREEWFVKIMHLDIEEHWKKVFQLYASTGARKREVFDGYIDGSFLIVPADKSKTKIDRIIKLDAFQKSVVKEMQSKFNNHIENGFKAFTFIDRYNKIFVKCLKKIGVYKKGLSLHSLRHTFAIIRYLQTRDIYQVRNEMGHTSVSTTEIYSNMNIHLILEHFPSFKGVGDTNQGIKDNNIKVIPFDKPLQLQRTSNP